VIWSQNANTAGSDVTKDEKESKIAEFLTVLFNGVAKHGLHARNDLVRAEREGLGPSLSVEPGVLRHVAGE
jgi:hypothetical protein